MLGNGNPICDAIDHRWLEEYYGYKCENCGAFVPYGSEPWLDDNDAEQMRAPDLAKAVRSDECIHGVLFCDDPGCWRNSPSG
jgi:hypothetical protein